MVEENSYDPYRKWLGISPQEQPPNHYRLLGLELFESDPDVIGNAADARMVQLKTYQSGKHSECSQQILNEVAAAQVCLLNPAKKALYDGQLEQKIEAEKVAGVKASVEAPPPQPPPVPPPRSTIEPPPPPPSAETLAETPPVAGLPDVGADTVATYLSSHKRPRWVTMAVMVAIILASALGYVGYHLLR